MFNTADFISDLENVTDWLLAVGVRQYLVDEVTLDALDAHGIREYRMCDHLHECNC